LLVEVASGHSPGAPSPFQQHDPLTVLRKIGKLLAGLGILDDGAYRHLDDQVFS